MKKPFAYSAFFSKSELDIISLKEKNKMRKFQEAVEALPHLQGCEFLSKCLQVFVFHQGKKNRDRLIIKALSRMSASQLTEVNN